MTVKNILPRIVPIVNSKFLPVAGGSVYCYTPGGAKTDYVATYKDSALTQPHTDPVKLSGSGRAEIWVSVDCDLRIEDRNGNLITQSVNVNPDSIGENQGSGLIVNGSFETDSDSNNVPDNWTLSSETGATNVIDTTTQTDGLNSFRFTSTGNGGGQLVTNDFFAVNDSIALRVDFDINCSAATGIRNIVRVEWYDASKVAISNTDVYDSTANPTTWTNQNTSASPPSGARFAKLRLIGIDTSTAVSGSTYFDQFKVFYPATVNGIFDNVTVQNNQVITTNTNGDLELAANAAGSVNVNQGTYAAVDLIDTNNTMNVGTAQPDSNAHLAVSRNQVQAKGGQTSTAALNIQPLGGNVNVGAQSSTGQVDLYGDSDRTLNVAGNGVVGLYGDSASDTDIRRLEFHSTSSRRGFIGHHGTTEFIMRNEIHGGRIDLEGQDASGNTVNLVTSDPDGETALYHAGSKVVNTIANGLQALGSLNNAIGSNQDARVELENSGGTSLALIGFASDTYLAVQNRNHGGNILLTAEDASGNSQTLFNGDPGGDAELYHAGVRRFRTLDSGSAITGSLDNAIGGDQNTRIVFEKNDGTDVARLGFLTSQNLTLQSHNHGGSIQLLAEDASGNSRNLFVGDPDGDCDIYYQGSAKLGTREDGIYVRGSVAPANGGTQDSFVLFENQTGGDIGTVGFRNSTGLSLRSDNVGGSVTLEGQDSGGTLRTIFTGSPNNWSSLYYGGVEIARTQTALNGGLQVNNTSTGSGLERVLTTSDLSTAETSGSWTPSWTGFSTAPTAVFHWVKVQYTTDIAIVFITSADGVAVTGTSNSTSMGWSSTGAPAAIKPKAGAADIVIPMSLISNGAEIKGALFLSDNGSATFKRDYVVSNTVNTDHASGVFNGAGTKGIHGQFNISYMIHDS